MCSSDLEFPHGGATVALVPTRYAPMPEGASPLLQLSRLTEWEAIGEQHFRGLGQRLLTTDTAEVGVLEARELVLDVVDLSPADEPDAADATDQAA